MSSTSHHFYYPDLPPSDPPDDSSNIGDPSWNIGDPNWCPSSDDTPLQAYVQGHTVESKEEYYQVHETSDDIPLQSLVKGGHVGRAREAPPSDTPRRPLQRLLRSRPRPRSSSLPSHPQEPSSDDILYTPQTERKILLAASHRKRLETLKTNKFWATEKRAQDDVESAALGAREKEADQRRRVGVFNEVLGILQENQCTLAEFLDYTFNPNISHLFDWRWRGFFQEKSTVERILGYWTSGSYSKGARLTMKEWVVGQAKKIASQEARSITESGLLKTTNKEINEDFFFDYSITRLTQNLRSLAPTFFLIADAFSTTPRQEKSLSKGWAEKKNIMEGSAILTLLKARSQKNNYAQAIHSTYLMATGAQRQHFTVFTSLGIGISYPSVITQLPKENKGVSKVSEGAITPKKRRRTPGTLYQLSQACRKTARKVTATGLFVSCYDNINMMIRVAEQILGRKNAQENGTCATIIPLHNATLEDLSTERLDEAIMAAPPLMLEHLELSEAESELMNRALVHTILSVIVRYGGEGFDQWKADLDKSRPQSAETIGVHQTSLHPLPAMEIDENTITGNVEVIDTIFSELHLDQGHEDFTKYVKIIAGDQLTIARQRSILNVRVGHESGADAWKHIVLMPGLFHAKIADCHGLLQVHFGKSSTRSPGSLAFHNTCLDRIPIVLTSLPSFRVCRDLSMVSLYARVLHCLLLVSGASTLEEYISKKPTWEAIHIHACKILETYANADRVQELREPRIVEERKREAEKKAEKKSDIAPRGEATAQSKKPQEVPLPHIPKGDMVFENASLFMRDALLTRLFSDAIKSGDSGLIILVLKLWSFSYRGSGRVKYAHEMLHLLHNLVNVWTSQLRKIIVQNWLLNPTGKANAFVEIDLVQEHLNFWIKKVYKADGDGHSWEWLSLVSPCIDVLRRLAKKIHGELGSQLGSKHTIPDLQKDIQTLMDALKEHEVYVVKEGRILDANDTPVPDVISTGLAALAHGNTTNPLAEFNAQYDSLRERRKLVPISDLCPISANTRHPESPTHVPIPAITEHIPANETGSEDEYEGLPELAITSDSEDEEDREDPYDEDLFADSPTLTRLEEEDVALEMDDLVLDDPEMDWDSDEQGDSDEDLD